MMDNVCVCGWLLLSRTTIETTETDCSPDKTSATICWHCKDIAWRKSTKTKVAHTSAKVAANTVQVQWTPSWQRDRAL